MSVRSSPMPPTSCGARTAFGCSRWTTAGAGYSPPSSIGTPSASAGMCASEATASPPFSRSPWGLRGCMPRPPLRRGGWAGTAPSICLTNQINLGHPDAFVERPRPTASPRGSITLKEQIIHGRNRNIAELRNAVRGFVNSTMPSGSWEERLPEPRSSSSGVAHRDVTQARRMRQTCRPRNRVR